MNNPFAKIRMPNLRQVFTGADEGAQDSRRRQKAQDDLGASHRKDDADAEVHKISGVARMQSVMNKDWFAINAGAGVSHKDDEIRIRIDRRTGITEDQFNTMVKLAMQKGWTELYVYTPDGKPDHELAKTINKLLAQSGLQDKLHCCTDPNKMCPHFKEMKRVARDPKALAALAGGAAVAAVAAAAVVDHLAHS